MYSSSTLLLLAIAIAAVSGQTEPCPAVPEGGCSVCGEGLCVTEPEAVFSFPPFPEAPCGMLQVAGYQGVVPLDTCPYLPGLVKNCNCKDAQPAGQEMATLPPSTIAPLVPTPDPTRDDLGITPTGSEPAGSEPAASMPTSAGAFQMTALSVVGALVVASIVA